MDCDGHACVPCGLHQPRRNAYFDGKLLLARDFEDEQAYHMAKRQLLNATLHGTGTVCGLKVVEHPADGCRADMAVLEPGIALDCCGQEIIVPARVPIPIRQLLDDNPDLVAALDGTRHLFVALKRCDRQGEMAPVILGGCDGEAEGGKPGRILEGYDFHLLAVDPDEVAPVEHHHRPRLDWRQTLTFSQATPVSVAIDNDARYAYVAVALDGADAEESTTSRVMVYEQRSHDIVTALDAPAGPLDLAVSPVGDQVYLSFSSADATGIAVYRKSAIRSDADPLAIIKQEGPVRLVVSPRTGALFALRLDTGDITAWSQEAIATWLGETDPDPAGPASPAGATLGDWTSRTPEQARGAVFTISPDGLRLLIVDGMDAAAVRIVEVALLFGGEPAESTPGGNPVLPTPAGERPVAASWSLDGRYVFLLSEGGTTVAPRAILRRYERLEPAGALAQRGQGVAVPRVHALDLAVAPGERWAYALVGALDNDRIEAKVVVLDMNLAQSGLSTNPPIEQLDAVEAPLPGEGLCQRLTLNGRQLYVALADESAEAQPDRGLVAVIEPDEADCGARFRDAVNGCPTCVDASHHVVLAHLANYVAADRPRIRDKDPRDGEVALDNFLYRPLIPSSQNLRAVIQCILDEGVAEGPPGPRGDPGDQGEPGATGPRGPGIEQIETLTLPAGEAATATLEPIDGDPENDLRLTIAVPRGADGSNGAPGPRGPGIQQVAVTTRPAGSSATAVLTPIAGDPEADLLLTLGIPRGRDAEVVTPDLGRVEALSWRHNEPMTESDFAALMERVGIAIGFDRAVRADTLIDPKLGREFSPVFELLTQTTDRTTCLCPVRAPVELIAEFQQEDGRILEVTVADDQQFVRGIRIPPNRDISVRAFARVLLRCDFVLDERDQAIDGNFLGGRLPTGDGIAGGLFESWFRVDGGT